MNFVPWFESVPPDPKAPKPEPLPLGSSWAELEAAMFKAFRRPL